MDNIKNLVIDRYYNEYDNVDRYFDLVCDIYPVFQEHVQSFLGDIPFDQFFDFITQHLNRRIVDPLLIQNHLKGLKREIGKIG